MTTHLAALSVHHLPAGESGLAVLDDDQARQIAARWTCTWRPALTAFATGTALDGEHLAAAVCDVRADLAEISSADAYALRTLLVHLQRRCEQANTAHRDDESYWCWCQPYLTPTPAPLAA